MRTAELWRASTTYAKLIKYQQLVNGRKQFLRSVRRLKVLPDRGPVDSKNWKHGRLFRLVC